MLLNEHVKPFDAKHYVIRMPSWNSVSQDSADKEKQETTKCSCEAEQIIPHGDSHNQRRLCRWQWCKWQQWSWEKAAVPSNTSLAVGPEQGVAVRALWHSGHLGWREHSLIPNSQRVKTVMSRLIIALSVVNHYDAPLDVGTIQYHAIQQLYCQVTRAQGMYQDAKSTNSRIHAKDHVKKAMRMDTCVCFCECTLVYSYSNMIWLL